MLAILLVLWQLAAASLAHAQPADDHSHCDQQQLQCHGCGDETAPPAGHGDDEDCGAGVCNCPCGHTPALRLESLDLSRPPLPAERPQPAVERPARDGVDEHFRPPA